MSALEKNNKWSAKDYLDWESEQDTKHELIDNYIVDMTGASRSHNIIASNIHGSLFMQLRDGPCELYIGDMRVQVDRDTTYTYPDIVVVCGDAKFSEDANLDTLENPTVIVEILSKSTESIDRKAKLHQYLQLKSLECYLLVAQDKARIESYTRQQKGWLYQDTVGLAFTIKVDAVDCDLPLADVYNKVQFPSDEDSDRLIG